MARVLFVCLHNAGRSQMSQALFERAAAGGAGHEASSAGTTPGQRVHPEVVEVMRELGVDGARGPQGQAGRGGARDARRDRASGAGLLAELDAAR